MQSVNITWDSVLSLTLTSVSANDKDRKFIMHPCITYYSCWSKFQLKYDIVSSWSVKKVEWIVISIETHYDLILHLEYYCTSKRICFKMHFKRKTQNTVDSKHYLKKYWSSGMHIYSATESCSWNLRRVKKCSLTLGWHRVRLIKLCWHTGWCHCDAGGFVNKSHFLSAFLTLLPFKYACEHGASFVGQGREESYRAATHLFSWSKNMILNVHNERSTAIH